jgi:hypothetical protein
LLSPTLHSEETADDRPLAVVAVTDSSDAVLHAEVVVCLVTLRTDLLLDRTKVVELVRESLDDSRFAPVEVMSCEETLFAADLAFLAHLYPPRR